jgi:hypothetical protein
LASTEYHTAVVQKLGGLYEIRSSLRPLVSPGAILIRRTLLSLKAETESRTHKLKTRAVTASAQLLLQDNRGIIFQDGHGHDPRAVTLVSHLGAPTWPGMKSSRKKGLGTGRMTNALVAVGSYILGRRELDNGNS